MTNGVSSGILSKGNGAVMNFEAPERHHRDVDAGEAADDARPRARGEDDDRRLHRTVGGHHAVDPLGGARTPTTSHPVRIVTPRSRARAAIAVVAR